MSTDKKDDKTHKGDGKKDDHKDGDNKDKIVEEKPAEPPKKITTLQELVADVVAWERATYLKDTKACFRLIRNLRRSKKNIKAHHVAAVCAALSIPTPSDLQSSDDFDKNYTEKVDLPQNQLTRLQKNTEVEVYVRALLLIYLMKKRKYPQAEDLCLSTLKTVVDANKRYLDMLRALLYFYVSRLNELKGNLKAIRNDLFEAYRTSCINRDEIGQAILLNLLLRNFLQFNEYEAASNLISKTKFPENKFNNEYIRYLYYKGRVRAVQLEYQEAFALLQQAIRKAPENTGKGFKTTVQKLACVVELLLGDLPARNIFSAPDMRAPLQAYFKLVKSVALGNLDEFYRVTKDNHDTFSRDRNLNLINRLHQNVIKTGLRRINLSYSRISLQDIAEKLKLHLESDDVEFIVAKAIRDGTMNGVIDHDKKAVVIHEIRNVYDTQDPQNAYQKRIAYCLHVHTAALKAHQYPESKIKIPSLEDRRSEIDEEELANMIDDFDDL